MKIKIKFNSIFSRIFMILVLSLMITQLVSNALWVKFYETKQSSQGRSMATELAQSVASTVNFFGELPTDYRHIILQQLRNMGGARFFVSVNDDLIDINGIEPTLLSEEIIEQYSNELTNLLGQKLANLDVKFADPTNLRVFKNDVRFIDLPDRWAQNALVLEGTPPLLVAQVQLESSEWLYLAALLPDPYFLTRKDSLQDSQVVFASILLFILTIVFWKLTRWLTNPLKSLALAAKRLGKDPLHEVTLTPSSTREIVQLSDAFAKMQQRLHRYIDDRDHLFSAISHDLKTPITRLRLRAEMLDESPEKHKFILDLMELEELVRGALQYSKGTSSTEKTVHIDIEALLDDINSDLMLKGVQFSKKGEVSRLFEGKPLAIKRCLSNLIENAFAYGQDADVSISNNDTHLTIEVRDFGPGIPEDQLKHVFEPFTRLEVSRNRNTGGSGLGLSIAKNLAHAHGGRLELKNHPERGLIATVVLPYS